MYASKIYFWQECKLNCDESTGSHISMKRALVSFLYNLLPRQDREAFEINKENEKREYYRCVICGIEKTGQFRYVCGKTGCICENCVLDASEALENQNYSDNKIESIVISLMKRTLLDDNAAPDKIKLWVKDSLINLSKYDIEYHRSILSGVRGDQNAEFIKGVISAMPFDSWGLSEAVSWTWSCWCLGKHEEALECPEFDLNKNKSLGLYLRLNLISNECELDLDLERVTILYKDLEELKTEVEEYNAHIEDQFPVKIQSNIYNAMAKCAFALEKYDLAIQHLKDGAQGADLDDYAELINGDIHFSLNHENEAKEAWNRGLSISDSRIVKNKLKEKLERLT